MVPIVTPAEMRAVDAAAPEPLDVLVDRAGAAVARTALRLLGGGYGRTVAVIAGPGNNGADGRVAAVRLRRRGVKVSVFEVDDLPPSIGRFDLVIDAAFGTGFRGEFRAPDVAGSPVLAVDVPSGLDALTGVAGSGVLAADRTVTFQALKPGVLLADGPASAGPVEVVDLGLDVSSTRCHLVERGDVSPWWPRRPRDAHKWRAAVRAVAGSEEMPGAAHLATAAALRSGAGIVTLVTPGVTVPTVPEVMARGVGADDLVDASLADLDRYGSMVLGPGLGRNGDVIDAVRTVIADAPVPIVVDGDGLFACARGRGATELVAQRSAATVVTPHDGEFRTLFGNPPGPDRIDSARRAAAALGAVVLLKGPTTIVAAPDSTAYVIDHGDQRLAAAGSGDVLAGMISAGLAAGGEPVEVAAAAAWLHADAARRGSAEGSCASDLIDALPAAIDDVRWGR